MGGNNNMNSNEEYDEVFEKYFPVFKTSTQRWLFMLGVTTAKIMSIEKEEYGIETFHRYLKDFKMSVTDLEGLAVRIFDKSMRLGRVDEILPLLETTEMYHAYMQDEHNLDNISVSDLNFYFITGFVHAWDFLKQLNDKIDESRV